MALAQGALLVGVALALFVEAVQRLGAAREILAGPMLAIAAGGLVGQPRSGSRCWPAAASTI